MDLDYTKEQGMLRRSVSEFLSKECPYDKVREVEESDRGYDPATWKKMARLGWMEIAIPEAYGGLGDPFLNTTIVLEEMGRKAFPSPYFTTAVWCSLILSAGATDKQKKALFPSIAQGEMILALAQLETDGGQDSSGISMQAELAGGQYRLNGTKMFVLDANIADKIIVAARVADKGISLFLVDATSAGVSCQKLPSLGMNNVCEVQFDNVKVNPSEIIGPIGKGWDILERVARHAIIAKCAEMLGGCRESIDITAEYAKHRVQYDTPIGGFQIIQHYMADMKIGYDTCLYYFHKLAWMVDAGLDVSRESSILKAQVNDQYKSITEKAVQIHGGVGTTREFNIGLFYRRAKAFESILGDSDYHLEKLAMSFDVA
ncbi:acyl-CoA/acyl-ACP dehydrogenase [bacterium]|nr:acyl-CoA/acyl-ACP dehydrogenase [bacterium]